MRKVFILGTAVPLATIVGTKLFLLPFAQWFTFFNIFTTETITISGRSAIGGILLGLITLLLLYRILGLHPSILTVYAWSRPIALGIQKLGCLFNGCCYGHQTNIPCGISYTEGTHAHFYQWQTGIISEIGQTTTSIHPVQLYETLTYVLLGIVIFQTKKYWTKTGSSLLFSFGSILILRSFLESFRDISSSPFPEEAFEEVRYLQIGLLLIGLIAFIIVYFNEKYQNSKVSRRIKHHSESYTIISLIMIVSIILFSTHEHFSTFEAYTIILCFTPALFLTGLFTYKATSTILQRLKIGIALLLSIALTSQIFPSQDSARQKFDQININTSSGTINRKIEYSSSSCGGISLPDQYFTNNYNVYSAGYAQVNQLEHRQFIWGVNMHYGTSVFLTDSLGKKTTSFQSLSSFFQLDREYFGSSIGFHLGKMHLHNNDSHMDNNEANKYPVDEKGFLLDLHLRLLPKEFIYIQFERAPGVFTITPLYSNRISVGTGFFRKRGYSFEVGYDYRTNNRTFLLETLLTKHIGIKAFMERAGGGEYLTTKNRYSFSLMYNFNYKPIDILPNSKQ